MLSDYQFFALHSAGCEKCLDIVDMRKVNLERSAENYRLDPHSGEAPGKGWTNVGSTSDSQTGYLHIRKACDLELEALTLTVQRILQSKCV
jgi:hypothetical protein